jgi:hypothetical protein
MVWDCLVVGLLWSHHIESLDNVTMVTIAIWKVGKLVLPRTSCLKSYRFGIYFYFGFQVAVGRKKGYCWAPV